MKRFWTAGIIGLLMWGVSETWIFGRVVSDYQSWVAFMLLAAGALLMLIAAARDAQGGKTTPAATTHAAAGM